MQYFHGIKLVDGIKASFEKLANLSGRSLSDIVNDQKKQIKNGSFKLKSLDEARSERRGLANYLWMSDLTANLLKVLYNYSPFRFLYGPANYNNESEKIMDLGKTLEVLLCKFNNAHTSI